MNVADRERHQGFACIALCDDLGSAMILEKDSGTLNRNSLGSERLPLQGRERRGKRRAGRLYRVTCLDDPLSPALQRTRACDQK